MTDKIPLLIKVWNIELGYRCEGESLIKKGKREQDVLVVIAVARLP